MATMLRRGSRGDEVKELQEFLNDHGFDAGTADGIFGGNTEKALKAFQESANLDVDGICGPATFGAIAGQRARDALKPAGDNGDDESAGMAPM